MYSKVLSIGVSESILIKAICIDINNWFEWKKLFKIENINLKSYRILSCVFKKLQNIETPDKETLLRAHEKQILNSEKKIKAALPAINLLTANNIRTILLGKTAALFDTEIDLANLLIDNFEILIEKSQFTKAIELLTSNNWGSDIKLNNQEIFQFKSKATFWNTELNGKITIHWNCDENITSNFFLSNILSSKKEITINQNATAIIPKLEDTFCYCCANQDDTSYFLIACKIASKHKLNWEYLKKVTKDSSLQNKLKLITININKVLSIKLEEEILDTSLFSFILNKIPRNIYRFFLTSNEVSYINRIVFFLHFIKHNYFK